MIPQALRQQLARLRRRLRVGAFVWGGARWLALAASLLVLAALIDWAIDRERDTPELLRQALSYAQIGAGMFAAFYFIVRPLAKRLSDGNLALMVEDKIPQFNHRLISAIELNRPGAATLGMSPELIGVVTQEALNLARGVEFAGLADPRRLRRGMKVAGGIAILAVLPFLVWPDTATALLARQFGADRAIPRNVAIESVTPEIWPSGEPVVLRFKVNGQNLDQLPGAVLIYADASPVERFPLELSPDSKESEDEAIVTVTLPPASTNCVYTAWLGDGRIKQPGHIRYEPRPVIVEQTAWLQFPEFCGVRPDGSRHEQLQGRGDILGIPGSSARVVVKVQKPIKAGNLELMGPEKFDPDPHADEPAHEVVKRTVPLAGNSGGAWQAIFAMRADETAYRINVVDQFGFANVPPPRRGLRLVPEEAPQVTLLKEQFPPGLRDLPTGEADDFVVEGLPLPLGGPIPIAYSAGGPYGLGQARLLFRVLKKMTSGNDDPGEVKWLSLPLQEVAGNDKAGPFDPRRGIFENSGPRDQIFFHADAGGTPLPRTLGGGRFDFKTTGIPDGKGGLLHLRVGDQIEYCIEVSADKSGNPARPSARSETRVKTVVSFGDLDRWLADNLQEAQRIRQLDIKQRGLFEEK